MFQVFDTQWENRIGFFRNKTLGVVYLFLKEKEGMLVHIPEGISEYRVKVGDTVVGLIRHTNTQFWEKIEDPKVYESLIEVVELPKVKLFEGLYHTELLPQMDGEKVEESQDSIDKAQAIHEVLYGKPAEVKLSFVLAKVRDMTVWRPFENDNAGIVVKGGHFPTGLISSSLAEF